MAELERILKRAIILRDIAGKDIYNNGKYRSRGADMELIVHNGHAWSKDLHFFQSREVHFYDGDVWYAICEATHTSPLAVWLLGGHDRQLTVDQLALQDGRTYRTKEAHERLQAICARLCKPELAEESLEKTTTQASWTRKRMPGNQPQPASYKTFRRLVWSTDKTGCGTRWTTIGGTSSASI